ncbi:MAG: flavodoxin family protein [Candidatus Omnitrophica bacterium]|nr:flavodoxin family protein [Candidatus Omnitrophota bacterium]
MKILLTYSSLTGNTKKIADGIYEILSKNQTVYIPIKEAVNLNLQEFDIIFIGCWVDKGMPNQEAKDFMKKINGKNVGIFMTLGAYPDSEHAKTSLQNAVNIIEENNNNVICKFICQGKISEKLIEFFKTLPKDHPHAITEEKLKRYEIASKHPNNEDIKTAQQIFKEGLDKLCNFKVD